MKHRQFTPEYKTKLILEVLKEERTMSEIAAREGLALRQLSVWKREFLENCPRVFATDRAEREAAAAAAESKSREDALMSTIGRLTMQVDFLKKKSEQLLGPDWEKNLYKPKP